MGAKQERPQPWLRAEDFDRLTKGQLGHLRQYQVAEKLGIHPTVWSLYRTQSRPVPGEIIAVLMDLLPGVSTAEYVSTARTEVPA